jgi:hypothetical protein
MQSEHCFATLDDDPAHLIEELRASASIAIYPRPFSGRNRQGRPATPTKYGRGDWIECEACSVFIGNSSLVLFVP